MKKYLIFLLPFAMLSCYISKSLDRDVHVRLVSDVPVTIFNNGNSHFSEAAVKDTFAVKFLAGLRAEFQTSRVIPDNVNPEFEIVIHEFSITESTKMETVNDTTSNDHGKKFELTKLELYAKGVVRRLRDNAEYSWYATKNKEESVTSLRSGGQIITGQNKEKNEYREKDFSADEAVDLSWNCGRRAGNSAVKEIMRSLN